MSSLKTLIKCNKFSNFFINNYYGHIIVGDLIIVNYEKLCQLMFKDRKYREPKYVKFVDACKEIQISIDHFTEKISIDKGIHKNYFSERKGNFMSSVNEKIHTLKTKITRGPLKSISVKMMFSLKEDFMIVLLKRQLKMVFICKHFYALTITK